MSYNGGLIFISVYAFHYNYRQWKKRFFFCECGITTFLKNYFHAISIKINRSIILSKVHFGSNIKGIFLFQSTCFPWSQEHLKQHHIKSQFFLFIYHINNIKVCYHCVLNVVQVVYIVQNSAHYIFKPTQLHFRTTDQETVVVSSTGK